MRYFYKCRIYLQSCISSRNYQRTKYRF